jgi:glutathione S-transferase
VRGRADGWTDWSSTTFWPNVRSVVVQLVRTSADKWDRNLIEESKRAAAAAATILDRELAKKPYVAGDHLTFGDIPLGATAQR